MKLARIAALAVSVLSSATSCISQEEVVERRKAYEGKNLHVNWCAEYCAKQDLTFVALTSDCNTAFYDCRVKCYCEVPVAIDDGFVVKQTQPRVHDDF
jgi:hypothetical protein